MLTEFGKFLRIIRIQCGEEGKDMAKKLGFSPSYLSSIENGKRNIPANIEAIILDHYNFSDEEKEKLHNVIIESSNTLKIELSNFDDNKKKLMLTMAQEDIDEKTIAKIYSMVKNGGEQ